MNTRKQGTTGVGSAIEYFTSLGWSVCVPLTDAQRYDLVVDDGQLKKVEIKTTKYLRNNYFECNLQTCGGNQTGKGKITKFKGKEVGYLFVLSGDGSKYCIPGQDVTCEMKLVLGPKYDKYRI